MKLILDSHVFLWWMQGRSDVSSDAVRAIEQAVFVGVSLVTPWELKLKAQTGKLILPTIEWHDLHKRGIEMIPIELDDVLLAAELHYHHRDPFDHLMLAQAIRRDLTFVTRDDVFSRYDVRIFWA